MTATLLYGMALGALLVACVLWSGCFFSRWRTARRQAALGQYKFYVEALVVGLVVGVGLVCGDPANVGFVAAATGVVLMRWLLGFTKPLAWRFCWQLLLSISGWALLLLFVFHYF